MARVFTAQQEEFLENERLDVAMFLDCFTTPTSLHCSSLYFDQDYDVGDGSRTYEGMGDRFDLTNTPLSMGTGLNPEPITINLDASRVDDDTDFIGRFTDSKWHRLQARLTVVLYVPGSNHATPVCNLIDWQGEMDFRRLPQTVNSAPRMALNIESGTFRYLGRNPQTRTDENQQRFFPGDQFFQDTAQLIGRELPWHRSWAGIDE